MASDRAFRILARSQPDLIEALFRLLAPDLLPPGLRITPENVAYPHPGRHHAERHLRRVIQLGDHPPPLAACSTVLSWPLPVWYNVTMEHLNTDRVLTIELPGGVGAIEMHRCDDHFFRKARSLAMPIELNSMRLCSLTRRPDLALPQIYAALTVLTGPSGDLYDSWKGAFSFPFKLTVRRDDREHRYLLQVTNFRSTAEPILYRIQQPSESYDRRLYHAPFDDELGTVDLIHALDFFRGFLLGYVESMPKWTTPFVKQVDSDNILFGYDPSSGDFFEHRHPNHEAYKEALKRLQTLLPEEPPERQVVELDW